MTAIRRSIVISAAGAFALLAACFPASVNAATEQMAPFQLPYELANFSSAPASAPRNDVTPVADAEQASSEPEAAAIDKDSLRCMAKVVHHESRGQPRKGQLAVAQTLINRLKHGNGRFGSSICEIANQHGQYFNTASYHPNEDSDDWKTAEDVSREAWAGADEVAPGALFFRAAYAGRSSFFASRQHVATIGGQIFYR